MADFRYSASRPSIMLHLRAPGFCPYYRDCCQRFVEPDAFGVWRGLCSGDRSDVRESVVSVGAPARGCSGVLVYDVLAVWAFAAVWTGALCLLAGGLVSLNHVMTIAFIQGTWALWGVYYYMTA